MKMINVAVLLSAVLYTATLAGVVPSLLTNPPSIDAPNVSPFIDPPTFPSWGLTQIWMKVKRFYPEEARLVNRLCLTDHPQNPFALAWTEWYGPEAGTTICFTQSYFQFQELFVPQTPLYLPEAIMAHELWHIHQFHFQPALMDIFLRPLAEEAADQAAWNYLLLRNNE